MADKRISVMLFLDNFRMGGTERFVLRVATYLDRARFAPMIGCFSEDGEFRKLVPEDVPVRVYPIPHGFAHPAGWLTLVALARDLRRLGVDVLMTSHNYTNVRAGVAARLAGVPLVTGQRGRLKPNRKRDRVFAALADLFAARIIANSQAIANETLDRDPISPNKIRVVPNGVLFADYAALRRQRDATRRALGVPQDAPLIVCVARVQREKGQQVLIEALARLEPQTPAPWLLLAGGGDLDAMREHARKHKLGERVVLPGMIDDIPALLAASDYFVLPSLTESFPNALVEAMQAGLPCIASRVGGVAEVLTHEQTGLLVEPSEVSQLAQALTRLLTDAELAARLGKQARSLIEKQYTLGRMMADIEAVLQDVAEAAHV
jgi:glycosyltransferase involved in cell wall biosynthesis